MFSTPLTELFGIQFPILSAPLGPDLSGPELVAAVSSAGGLGILQAQLHPPDLLRDQIRQVRDQTDRPFGVNFILQFPCDDGVRVCIEERVSVLSFFWGDVTPYIVPAHDAGIRVIHQVGCVEEAQQAAAAGVDAVIAQGVEAGGHVRGEVSTLVLVPRVSDSVTPLPVIAAGGIADARGFVAALSLGAAGVSLGTRFLASVESRAHPHYKRKLVASQEDDTVRTILFGHGWPHAPHRTLRTPFVETWIDDGERTQQSLPDEPAVGETTIARQTFPVLRFQGFPPNEAASGDIDSMALLAGQSVGLVHEIKPAAQIVRDLVSDAEQIMRRLAEAITYQSKA